MSANSGKAAAQAQAQENARRNRVKETTKRIDTIFDDPKRTAQYDQLAQDLLANFSLDANRQKAVADRQLRFSLARGGQTGGSAAVDAGRVLRDDYTRGILKATQQAQGGAADLRNADQTSRMNLIQLANAGTDVTSAAANAASAMRASLEGARSGAVANGLGDIFANSAGIYQKQQEAAERRRAQTMPLGGYYSMGRP
jgi:hypothetical protein